MRFLEWLFLQVYPRDYRDEYSAEMLAVLRELWREAETPWQKIWLVVHEVEGAVRQGAVLRVTRWEGWPVAGGLTLAILLHWALYVMLGYALRWVQVTLAGPAENVLLSYPHWEEDVLRLSGYGLLMVLLLVFCTLLLTRRLRLGLR